MVFVTGEPGIGKTALVEEFERLVSAAQNDVRIAHGQCVEGFGSKEPFYPVLEAVGALCHAPDGERSSKSSRRTRRRGSCNSPRC